MYQSLLEECVCIYETQCNNIVSIQIFTFSDLFFFPFKLSDNIQ